MRFLITSIENYNNSTEPICISLVVGETLQCGCKTRTECVSLRKMAANIVLKLKDRINPIVERLIFGYLRRIESSHGIVVPLEIKYIFAQYAILEFISIARFDHFEITNNALTVKNIKDCDFKDHTIICNEWVDSMVNGIYKWTFKIRLKNNIQNVDNNLSRVFLGFITSTFDKSDKDFKQKWNSFAIGNKGTTWRGGILNIKYQNDVRYMFNDGDKVTLILDTMDKDICLQINQLPQQKQIHKNIKKAKNLKHKLVIQLKYKGDHVTLLKYSAQYFQIEHREVINVHILKL